MNAELRNRLKPWILPIAMVGGMVFHNVMGYLAPFSPWLIFVMLLITYCKVNLREFRLTSLSGWLILIQLGGSLALYLALLPFNREVAQGAFICVFCPTATAAPVITGMLGGSVPRLATFSLVSNFAVAILAPILFTWMNPEAAIGFVDTTMIISLKVVPLILGPLAVALLLRVTVPKVHGAIASHQSLSFYIWAVSLFIVVGTAMSYIINHHDNVAVMSAIACVSLIVCCLQFYVGRIIGRRCGDKIAGAQGLGQKNTVLAIWMALTFLHPITSIGPAAYVAWQNTINSLQLYFHARKSKI